MTRLSRSRGASPVRRHVDPPRSSTFTPWPAACFLLGQSGCFYLGPEPILEENVQPTIVATAFEDGTDIQIGPLGQSVYVIADDADDDELRFSWLLSEDGYVGTAYPIAEGDGSQVDFISDPDLDGQLLDCIIEDHVTERVRLTWRLEVL